MDMPSSLVRVDKRRRKAQRMASRLKRGSKRDAKAQRRVAALAARQARTRRDWHHKATKTIAGRFGTVVLEKLNTKGMTASAKGTVENPGRMVGQKAGLNRSILNQGWVAFETILAYKLKDCGGYLFKVDPRDTSQTCSACGVVDRQSRESQAHFACSHCGHRTNADVNAALNILKRNTASEHGVAGHGGLSFVPREVSTEQAHQGLEILGL